MISCHYVTCFTIRSPPSSDREALPETTGFMSESSNGKEDVAELEWVIDFQGCVHPAPAIIQWQKGHWMIKRIHLPQSCAGKDYFRYRLDTVFVVWNHQSGWFLWETVLWAKKACWEFAKSKEPKNIPNFCSCWLSASLPRYDGMYRVLQNSFTDDRYLDLLQETVFNCCYQGS